MAFTNKLNGLQNAGCKFEQFISCQNEGNISRRRKSSVSFSRVLEQYEPEKNESPFLENENQEFTSYLFSSSPRMSMFSRMSEVSIQSLGAKYQCFLIICCLIMGFLIGVAVGAITVKSLLCNGSSLYQVNIGFFFRDYLDHL